MAELDCDYFVVGTGGTAMAFVDTLLAESNASVVMVDRHHRPGGHWNDAYPFVKLHQPSAWYGVASRELSSWTRDCSGVNAGMYSLASGAEVLAHFDQVMQHRFLASGRVRWFPKCDYLGSEGATHRFASLTSGEQHTVRTRRKFVNATHAKTEVPATHGPRYAVSPAVRCVPLNALPQIERPCARYTVIGSGKSGMDACLWLMDNGVPPARIRWIMPRDAWLMDRANFQPGAEGFERGMASTMAQFDAIVHATDLDDLFARLERDGVLMRIDTNVRPTTYRCAIVSRAELAKLREVGEIVRLGHVRALQPGRIVLDRGSVEADEDTLYVDCTASAIQATPRIPIFDGDVVNLLMVRWCQPLFSAAVIAWVESHVADAAEQNALCRVVPGPAVPLDWLRMWAITLANVARWRGNRELQAWLAQCRLNGQAVMMRGVEQTDAVHELLRESMAKAAAAGARLPQLMAALA